MWAAVSSPGAEVRRQHQAYCGIATSLVAAGVRCPYRRIGEWCRPTPAASEAGSRRGGRRTVGNSRGWPHKATMSTVSREGVLGQLPRREVAGGQQSGRA
ncbi:hypothetical protein NDU88_003948 [Pleurodeles waltl]|uniref:Uncharacterized protein n=1 Tax=Pleurodeles waltl TaxID=8319 RepID=A0AAV7QBI2_PLEWA|nr:hypothetical protein NDU88_003948 [Pleurodeles waltl]